MSSCVLAACNRQEGILPANQSQAATDLDVLGLQRPFPSVLADHGQGKLAFPILSTPVWPPDILLEA